MKKNQMLLTCALLAVLILALAIHFAAGSDFLERVTQSDSARTTLILGRDDANDGKITGALLWRTHPDSETIDITPYASNTVLSKGGQYKNHLYGGSLTINALYQLACAWDDSAAAAGVMQQAFLANFDVSIDELIVISSADFETLFEYTEMDTTYRIVS